MTQIGTKLRVGSGKNGFKHVLHACPGCDRVHAIKIAPEGEHPVWSFNGDFERPTFSPSVRLSHTIRKDIDGSPLPAPYAEQTICHYFITDGKIVYCGDSAHALAGQTVDLPDWPFALGTYGGIDDE